MRRVTVAEPNMIATLENEFINRVLYPANFNAEPMLIQDFAKVDTKYATSRATK